jgi:TniQ
MTPLRTLPVRIAPLPGEALDSWLEALAYRMHMPVGDLLGSVGLKRSTVKEPGTPAGHWMAGLRPEEAATIAVVTGAAEAQVLSMTLAAYDGRALIIDPATRVVSKWRLWGRGVGSRYCPYCLTESGGRWSLAWRLGWSFACLRHRCLLADACPRCGRIQRAYRYRGKRPIHPAHCCYAAPGSTASTRCGTDLREVTPVLLVSSALDLSDK